MVLGERYFSLLISSHRSSLQGKDVGLRSLAELINVYHQTVGHNCLLMLDLSPDRTGLIPSAYAQRYKELGDFIRSCYATTVAPAQVLSSDNGMVHLLLFNGAPVSIDRSMIQEDQTNGQVIRQYVVDIQPVETINEKDWMTVATGTSIGNKKIDLWDVGPQLVNAVRLTITDAVDTPVIKAFSVHLCYRPSLSN
jgi:alpha-L-fucosidase